MQDPEGPRRGGAGAAGAGRRAQPAQPLQVQPLPPHGLRCTDAGPGPGGDRVSCSDHLPSIRRRVRLPGHTACWRRRMRGSAMSTRRSAGWPSRFASGHTSQCAVSIRRSCAVRCTRSRSGTIRPACDLRARATMPMKTRSSMSRRMRCCAARWPGRRRSEAPGVKTIRTAELVRLAPGGPATGHRHSLKFLGRSIPGAIGLKFSGLGGSFADEAQDRLAPQDGRTDGRRSRPADRCSRLEFRALRWTQSGPASRGTRLHAGSLVPRRPGGVGGGGAARDGTGPSGVVKWALYDFGAFVVSDRARRGAPTPARQSPRRRRPFRGPIQPRRADLGTEIIRCRPQRVVGVCGQAGSNGTLGWYA